MYLPTWVNSAAFRYQARHKWETLKKHVGQRKATNRKIENVLHFLKKKKSPWHLHQEKPGKQIVFGFWNWLQNVLKMIWVRVRGKEKDLNAHSCSEAAVQENDEGFIIYNLLLFNLHNNSLEKTTIMFLFYKLTSLRLREFWWFAHQVSVKITDSNLHKLNHHTLLPPELGDRKPRSTIYLLDNLNKPCGFFEFQFSHVQLEG